MAGIYIHIPFCKQACTYCNFHFSTSLKSKNDLLTSIHKEIELQDHYLNNEPISTIYFGGGTPSLLNADELEKILSTIYKKNTVDSLAEITLEANPDDLDATKIRALKQVGINRLSIGVQSFIDRDLAWMRRAHNAMQAHNCIESALEVGYKNISVDLIYGIPQQSSDEWIKNIETVCNFGIPHISCYALTIEPKTVLQKLILSKKIAPLDDEKTVTDFNILTDILKKNNYEHYEISNFARDGNYAKHNTSYWQNKKYLGIGPSSHSFNGDSRQWNVANNAAYINSILKKIVPFEKEILTPTQKLNEKIMTSLRTMWGLNLIEFEEISGKVAMQVFASEIAPYLASGHLHIHKNVLKLSDRGIMLADKIMSDLFFED